MKTSSVCTNKYIRISGDEGPIVRTVSLHSGHFATSAVLGCEQRCATAVHCDARAHNMQWKVTRCFSWILIRTNCQ